MGELVLIDERFELRAEVARGGMGAVYRALDRKTQQTVAVKVLRDQAEDAISRFRHEARVLGEVEHSHVVRYIAHGEMVSGDSYLVMEWLEGETLETRLERGPLGIEETAELARRVASGLGAAHVRGIVHRDVKPGNLFLEKRQISRVKLLDFGIARQDASAKITVTGTFMGTPGYMAPEQVKGSRNRLDARVDVFSLGCVIYECLTGRPAFHGTHVLARLAKLLMEDPPRVRELRPEVPEVFDELISRMLSKDPEGRPTDGRALALQFERMGSLHGLQVEPRAPLPPSLTHTEKRLVSVVTVVPLPRLGTEAVGEGAGVIEDNPFAEVRRIARNFGAKVEEVDNGMFFLLLVGTGPATDQAAAAARCALRLRLLMPSSSIVLLTGRGETTGRLPVGEIFERALLLLERMNSPGPTIRGIYIDEITRALLDVRFSISVESGHLVLWGEQDVAADVRTLLGKPSPFVGRDRELRHLLDMMEEAIAERHGRVVLVTGEAGTGKSRLRYEFMQRLRSKHPGVIMAIGRGDSMSAGSAFVLLGSAFRRSLAIIRDESLEIARDKLADAVSPYVVDPAERVRVTEFLGELIGIPCADEKDPRMLAARQTPAIMADQIQSAYLEFVRAVVEKQIVIFVLEDMHWGDGASVNLIDAALRELSDSPFIVVAFARPEVLQVFPHLWAGRGVHPITLGGLSRRGSETLIKNMLGTDIDPTTIRTIVDQSGGNAFYLEELIRAVAEGRGAQLPETVLGMVETRIAALEPEARRILRAASIFGDTFWERGLHQLLRDESSSDSQAYIEELCASELITRRSNSRFSGDVEYGFRHSLLREGAYAMLTDRDRALGHDLAGEWLRSAGEPDPMVLAEHFERGTTPGKAARFYARAAEQALRGADFPAAIVRTEKGLALGVDGEARAALRGVLSSGYILTAQYAKAYENAALVLADGTLGTSSRARALGYAVASAILLGKYDVFGELFPEILSIEPTPDVAALIQQALYSIFMMFIITGQGANAGPYLQRMVELAKKYRDADFLTAAWTEFALMFAAREMKNDLWLTRQHNLAAADRYAAAGAREYLAITKVHLGLSYMQLGLRVEAEELFDRVLATPGAGNLAYMRATYHKCRLLVERIRFDEALLMTAKLAKDALAASDFVMLWCARLLMVGIFAASGKLDQADTILDELGETNAFLPFLRARFLSLRADVLRRRGQFDAAVPLAAESVAVGRLGPRYSYGQDPLHLRYALILHGAGRLEEARVVIREARDDLLGCAAKIPEKAARTAYLENIRVHAQTLEIANKWLNDVGDRAE